MMFTVYFAWVILAGALAATLVHLTFFKNKGTPLANDEHTPKDEIIRQMNEPRPLPMGQKEFMEWSDRIISGALIPTESPDSLRAALSVMIMQLGPTESHKPDAFFIHSLRKAAANQVAHANFEALKKKREEQAKAEAKDKVVPLTPA